MESKRTAHQGYVSPFSTRYSSPEMSYLFSAEYKTLLFRTLWVELAKGQKKLGLPITEAQIAEMEAQRKNIDFACIDSYEKKFRHEFMAHIYAFGELCPTAKPILHLGATSSYVADNADLIQLKEGLSLLLQKLLWLLQTLADLATRHAADPTLSYTHFQPAQPTTIGKRISLWLHDFLQDAYAWVRVQEEIPFLGVKGATGTQASFLTLFQGDQAKVLQLEQSVAQALGFQKVIPVAGQTYSRKIDLQVLQTLASFAASAHKCATDIRLLAHEEEMAEPFSPSQIGSSAMPYKRNPLYSERICGIARFVISLSQNPAYTAATQWLERSLDDSSNRRLAIPETFLATDALLNLLAYILTNPEIDPKRARMHCEQNLPLLCMESILMHSVKKGGDRQELHEKLRQLAFHSSTAVQSLPHFIEAIVKDPAFHLTREETTQLLDLRHLTGRAQAQVEDFVSGEVLPFLSQCPMRRVKPSAVEI